jgi:alkanesulfonate monooxygenase SsuD/methylene tetrahydromethanopterin reductase-like flavin-dependent oxidoreductase (luciferase family)
VSQLRDPAAPPLVVATGPIAVADDNARHARDMAASCTAWYLTAMGDVYATSVSSQGYATEVKTIIAANPRPSPRHGIVPADAQVVLDQLAACGTPDQVREQLEPWDEATDTASIIVPPGLPWSTIEATIRAAAPGA